MADYQLSYTGDQVNTAIGQIINKNITGTLTIETLALTNPLAITQGGTGKDNRIDAFSNLADYGSVTESATNDIPGVWASKGSGVHSFTGSSGGGGGSIEGIYSGSTIYNWVTYRYMAGHLSPDTVTQFRIINGGSCYTRFGYAGETVWSKPWTLATKSIQIKTVWENASPTSAFANQTLTLDLLSYDLVIILFNLDSNSRSTSPAIVPIGHPGVSLYGNNVRGFLVHTNDINFDSVSPSSAVMIPYVIYGVKGVI